MLKEEFVKIKGFLNYSISNFGQVRNDKKGKLLTIFPHRDGYTQVFLYRDGKRKTIYTHRLVAEAFLPNPENKRTINHIDGVKKTNFLLNLEWATDSEQAIHAYRNNLASTKLSDDDIREIRQLLKEGVYQRVIGEKFGVLQSTISRIKSGELRGYLV